MKLSDVSIKRPVGVIMIVLGILALGFVSLKNLAIDLFPEIDLPVAAITTTYSGAGPQEVEQLVTRPIEAAISSLQGIDTIQSVSQPHASLIIMLFQNGTDLDNALLEVRERVDQVKGMLPENAGDPGVIRFDPQQTPIMTLGLGGADLSQLEQLAEDQVVPYLERVDHVASVTSMGGRTREIQLVLDQAELRQYGLSAGQIAQALQAENRSASAGVITKGSLEQQIRINGEFVSLQDIASTLIPLPAGGHITVGDIADIQDTFVEETTITQVNGKQALVLSVMKQSGGNTVEVAEDVSKAITRIQERLPDGVELSVVMDMSTFIRSSIDSVISNLIVGGGMAVLILILFLRSIRPVLVISVSIPIAVISTFTLMYFTGQTLNIISMGGLALGIGMMVDSSIVILENIFTHRQRGASPMEAARKGASELGSAVVASTLTTMVVFVPIIYVEGLASDLFTPMALTVAFSLFASMVAALTIVPMLGARWLSNKSVQSQTSEKGFNRWFIKLSNGYRNSLKWALGHRKTTVWTTFALFILSFVLIPFIGFEFAPESDQGSMQIMVETPAGTKLEETEKIVDQVQEQVQKYENIIETSYMTIGSGGGFSLGATSNQATFFVQLVPSTERDITTQELTEELNQSLANLPGAEIEISSMGVSFSMGAPIQVKLIGPELDILNQLSEEIVMLVSQIEGTHNVTSTQEQGRPEIQVEIKRDISQSYGLSYMQIMQHLDVHFNGQVATLYREDGNEYDVRLVVPKEQRTTISDLETLVIPTPSGALVPLSSVAELKQIQGPTAINRENQQRQVNITSEILGRDLISVTSDINRALANLTFPEGYDYSTGGETEDMQETFADLGLALVFAIFLIYVVMAVQFESVLYPFVVMFSIPTMLIGVLFGSFVTGTPISIMTFIGLIILAGIVVNNAIILIDYINQQRGRGIERQEAIIIAGPARLRAIMMTVLTTVLAMVPMALGIGEGSEQQAPMAITVIFGLMFSTLFTLFLVPVVYTYLDDISNWIKRVIFRKPAKPSTPAPTGGLEVKG